MTVAIHQPNYIPWLGFFNKMASVDVFVLLDNVKHSKSSITHRNKIKTPAGELLLSVPLKNKEQLINTLLIDEPAKNLTRHWRIIEQNYSRAAHWNDFAGLFHSIYSKPYELLADLNIDIIKCIKQILGIQCELVIASTIAGIEGIGSNRNLSICKALNANCYLSGNGAKQYNDEASFTDAGVRLEYNNFKYRPYTQLYGGFIPNLSAIDAIFNTGSETKNLIS